MAEFQSRPQKTLRVHPDWAKPNIPDDLPLDKWSGIDKSDYADKRHTFRASRADWERIFGPRSQGAGKTVYKWA
jgi:hypothetical protein